MRCSAAGAAAAGGRVRGVDERERAAGGARAPSPLLCQHAGAGGRPAEQAAAQCLLTVHQLSHRLFVVAVQQAGNAVELALKLLYRPKHAHLAASRRQHGSR